MDIKSTDIRSQSLSSFKPKKEVKGESNSLDVQDKFDRSPEGNAEPFGKKVGNWIQKHIIGDTPDTKTRAQMNKMMAIGAAGGGAVGAVAGFAMGYENAAKDKVTENWQTHDIKDPKLEGWTHRDVEDGHYVAHEYVYYTTESVSHTGYNSDGSSYTYYTSENVRHTYTYYTYEHDGYWHRNDPTISWTKVGEWKTPHLEHSNSIGPLGGALIGLGAGAVGGGIIGAVCSHIFKVVKQLKED
ncbi:MAG: hypothetical protein ABRQ39_10665 [Candidatus Eremiobacterota bacterium]